MKLILKKYWQAFRLSEVILMSGFFIIGSFFSITNFDAEVAYQLFGLVILSFAIVLSVYSFNAAAGKAQDTNNLRLKNLWNFSKPTFLKISALFFAFSLIISFSLSIISFSLTIVITFLWILYSHPVFGLKQKAIYGTLIHFVGQILHFVMAWVIFKDFSTDALLIATFFAIAFSSGHLLHEIIDYDADKNSGFMTSPILFGIKKTSTFLVIILAINSFLICYLVAGGIITTTAWGCFFTAATLHLILILVNIKNIKSKAMLVRNIYRSLYFFAGIIYFVIILLKDIY